MQNRKSKENGDGKFRSRSKLGVSSRSVYCAFSMTSSPFFCIFYFYFTLFSLHINPLVHGKIHWNVQKWENERQTKHRFRLGIQEISDAKLQTNHRSKVEANFWQIEFRSRTYFESGHLWRQLREALEGMQIAWTVLWSIGVAMKHPKCGLIIIEKKKQPRLFSGFVTQWLLT